ncbi:MAG: hypothetical protein ACREOG_21010, partial [Gemmatimonadaceae bacterium]
MTRQDPLAADSDPKQPNLPPTPRSGAASATPVDTNAPSIPRAPLPPPEPVAVPIHWLVDNG